MSLSNVKVEELIEFKGDKKGIVVNVRKKSSFNNVQEAIIERIGSSIGFFNGAKIHCINCDYLSDIQIIQIKDKISSKFDVEFIEDEKIVSEKIFETKYVGKLRSGENIEFDGDIVVMADMKPGSQVSATSNVIIMGDVSPGARVVAGGNITVMGKLKGFVHAGCYGNDKAYVVSNYLEPKVLKIANNMAEAPEEQIELKKEINQEIAFISEGIIVIEGYANKA